MGRPISAVLGRPHGGPPAERRYNGIRVQLPPTSRPGLTAQEWTDTRCSRLPPGSPAYSYVSLPRLSPLPPSESDKTFEELVD